MRIGKEQIPVIWQGAKPHGNQFVGNGLESFRAVGCVVTCVAMACRYLGARAGATPIDVNNKGIKLGAFAKNSSACTVRDLIDSQGCIISGNDLPGAGRYSSVDDLRPFIETTIQRGGVCLLHVDYDSKTGGDEIGDHWICAFAIDTNSREILCGDPATARTESLSLDTLSAVVSWQNKKKPYLVRRAVAIFPF